MRYIIETVRNCKECEYRYTLWRYPYVKRYCKKDHNRMLTSYPEIPDTCPLPKELKNGER